ncbi:MAG: hypothetical protein P8O70_12095 [SAR324 cluster bacterium]|nr:hypothetical protein [SAR324 cluster bacterium]
MKPPCHFLVSVTWLILLSTPLAAQGIDNQTTISWIGLGSVEGSYVTKSGDKSISLTGDALEIMFWQDREKSGFFDGLQLLQLELSGTGIDGRDISHDLRLEMLNLQYHFGWNWDLFNFVHLQLFVSYGIGQTRFSVALQQEQTWSKNFEEQHAYSDMTSYGTNLILELTDRLWLGYSTVYVQDSQSVNYGYTQSEFSPTNYQSILIVYKWQASSNQN